MVRTACVLIVLVMNSISAEACTYTRGPFLRLLDKWGQTCGHPLCGRIVKTGPTVTLREKPECSNDAWMNLREDIQKAVVEGGSVLFGDVHDNPDHHELHSRMALSTFASIVLEQVRADQYAGLEKFKELNKSGANEGSIAIVLSALDWEKSGWSKFRYEPLLRGIILSRRPVFAGDPSTETMDSVVRDGKGALLQSDMTKLKLDLELGEKLDSASKAEIAQGHCGTAAASADADKIAFAQRYRDAHMADALISAIEKHGSAALFAGNTHVRTDRGVPWYLRQRAPDKKIVSVMLVEVEKGKTEAEAYIPRDPDGKVATDYLVFTPAVDRPVNCGQPSEKQ